jgi:predicted Zn-dependent peptidase
MILGFAGNFVVEQLDEQLQRVFGDWQVSNLLELPEIKKDTFTRHLTHDSAQTHIGISYPSVTYDHPDYFNAWAAVSILSGGMSSRLFTKVREERGLCYSIGASLYSLKNEAQVLCYAGTTNERAQETLDVTLQVLGELKQGIKEEELSRCKAMAKSSLIMQQESTISRSGKIARDYFFLGRVMGMQEIRERVESLTVGEILDFLHRQPEPAYNIVTLGPEALEQTRGI